MVTKWIKFYKVFISLLYRYGVAMCGDGANDCGVRISTQYGWINFNPLGIEDGSCWYISL